MLDHARPDVPADFYPPPTAPPGPLENFGIFKKTSNYVYGDYYSEHYEQDPPATAVYHELVSPRSYPVDYSNKPVESWNQEDTLSWLYDTAKFCGYQEWDVPFYNFRVTGSELAAMSYSELHQRMMHPHVDQHVSRLITETIYEKLKSRLNMEQRPLHKYQSEYEPTLEQSELTNLDLHNRQYLDCCNSGLGALGSESEEEPSRHSETASPYSSDVSKSGDEEDRRKQFKRPPGRPKGSGRKVCKRPRSVSVPEFLRNLLLDHKYCPCIIKWEDYDQAKFRFVKPDEVAKLWGKMKQNDNMTFEKFSRAMRYHYRQGVLVSVPTARLVYQFGPKGPDIRTDNPNFVKVKSEHDMRDLYQ